MKKIASFVAAMFLTTPVAADVIGHGPECVRAWTRVFKSGIDYPPGDVPGDMRQMYRRSAGGVSPVEFIAWTCRMDRALAAVVIKDETEATGLPQGWNLP